MKTLAINALALSMFRGHQKFQADLNSSDAVIYGDNGLGKTSIGDAILWVLTGKNLAGSTQFDIKTWGSVKAKHEVAITFAWEGQHLELRRVYREDWSSGKGRTGEPEFKGHTTDFFIDDVPKTEATWTAFLSGIATPEQIHLLMRPEHFMSLPWQTRRQMLIDAFGDVTVEDVVQANPELADIPGILGKLSVADKREQLKTKRKPIAAEVQAIPERLAENQRNLPDESLVLDTLPEHRERLEALQKELAEVKHGGAIATKRLEAREIESKLKDAKADAKRAAGEATQELRNQVTSLKSQVDAQETRMTATKQALFSGELALNDANARMVVLREEHKALKDMVWQGDRTCSTCGQALPPEKVEDAKAAFNRGRAERLEANIAKGKPLYADIVARTEALENLRKSLAEDEAALEARKSELRAAEEALRAREKEIPEFVDDPELLAQLSRIVAEIEDLRSSTEDVAAEIEEKIAMASANIAEIEASAARQLSRTQILDRIKELEASHKKHVAELHEIDRQNDLLDQFVAARIRMLETKINGEFERVTWKLFETQVNGNIKEICEPCFGECPYSTSLSTSEKINAGLDIINAFARHWGLALPVIIDDGESVLHPLPTYGQQIRLFASINEKNLRVELIDRHETPAIKEALAS